MNVFFYLVYDSYNNIEVKLQVIELAKSCGGMMSDREDIDNLDSIKDYLAIGMLNRLRTLKLDNLVSSYFEVANRNHFPNISQ